MKRRQIITFDEERAMSKHQPLSQKDYEKEEDETPREYRRSRGMEEDLEIISRKKD